MCRLPYIIDDALWWPMLCDDDDDVRMLCWPLPVGTYKSNSITVFGFSSLDITTVTKFVGTAILT